MHHLYFWRECRFILIDGERTAIPPLSWLTVVLWPGDPDPAQIRIVADRAMQGSRTGRVAWGLALCSARSILFAPVDTDRWWGRMNFRANWHCSAETLTSLLQNYLAYYVYQRQSIWRQPVTSKVLMSESENRAATDKVTLSAVLFYPKHIYTTPRVRTSIRCIGWLYDMSMRH